jgi:hypothetical protein
LPLGAEAIAAYAAALPADGLTLRFQTPLRLIDHKRLVKRLTMRLLIQRLKERLDQLALAYGDCPPAFDLHALLAAAEHVVVADDQTRWVDVVSYLSRTRERTPIGGLVGSVMFEGKLAGLRELLVWGSLIHVGKNAVKGDGWYTIAA